MDGPSVMALTRQNLTVFEKEDSSWREHIRRGAYTVKGTDDTPELVLIATGSEVELALQIAEKLGDLRVRVVSMPCRELFLTQDKEYRDTVLPPGVGKLVIEAGVSCGWQGITGENGMVIGIDRFGESGPGEQVAEYLGLSLPGLVERIQGYLKKRE
jgi:transketolase